MGFVAGQASSCVCGSEAMLHAVPLKRYRRSQYSVEQTLTHLLPHSMFFSKFIGQGKLPESLPEPFELYSHVKADSIFSK